MRTRYIALVEVEAGDELTAVASITDALSDFEPSLHKLSPGLWQVRMQVHADGLAAACANATSVAQAVTGATAISAQVVSEHHHQRGAGPDPLVPEQPVLLGARRSASGSTRGQTDLSGVLSGTFELRDTSDGT